MLTTKGLHVNYVGLWHLKTGLSEVLLHMKTVRYTSCMKNVPKRIFKKKVIVPQDILHVTNTVSDEKVTTNVMKPM